MKTAIAIHHVCFENLGTLGPLLEARGYTVRYVDATVDDLRAPDLASPDLLVILGGPIGAFDEAQYPFIADELRSEEHTSELQSRATISYAVFCLKKKT